eukprot:g1276.t1
MSSESFKSRVVSVAVFAQEQGEGQGARVRRTIGRPELRNLDPFLMLDEFRVKLPAGFPDHPHRGFETVTYMHPESPGAFTHEDCKGNKGIIAAGDLQWMTAGKGILHSEVPESRTDIARGLQLWINLPSTVKMCEPSYQEVCAKDIPSTKVDGVHVRVVAGESLGVTSPITTRTPTTFFHFKMDAGAKLAQKIASGWNSFAYIFEGKGYFGSSKKELSAYYTATFTEEAGDEDGLSVEAGEGGIEFVLISGKPINESIVQHGPFVMNTREEIYEAFVDYQNARRGFEGARGWRSKNGERCR